ncbi:uncharacterized protein LOC131026164 [Salvia miltiorrhiza]|uniref:uncharacterized protein LOC131026164 n=1 Tax=Salvia miltiorrhiza TaxID=226208 RepID=UPI0025AB8471|nr:uncharacterized protein LOC131026164 [Salvia miltiorrhiza]
MNDFYSDKEISEDLYKHLKIMESDQDLKLQEFQFTENNSDEEEEEVDEEEEEEFSFVSVGEDGAAAIAAEDAFSGGRIKAAAFPLFDQSLLFAGDGEPPEDLPMRPPVKKVFVETSGGAPAAADENIAGPYCEWSSRKAVEAAPAAEACKKSNSTGFSKIWRLKEITCRSNSDGRDAFVFLNGGHAPPHAAAEKAAPPPVERTSPPPPAVKGAKKGGKGKAAVSPHEVYLRSKAKEEERRRSYLPYRPELMGFFTNINGGLTRNVHPF